MSDPNVSVTPLKTLDLSKDGVALPSKSNTKVVETSARVKLPQDKAPQSAAPFDLNYSIDHENNALHLKVKSANGELVREVVFRRIDPKLFDAKKLKGIFVDDNS